ncbi:MAG TPA: ATP-binding protein [Planctomycetota bacterium]|nr:ATP-binding protein [Planctomycetota bacterium]
MSSTVGEGFWGDPGMGKTTLAQQRMILRAGDRGVPCIFFDIERNLLPPGAEVIRGTDPEAIIAPVWDEGLHVVYSPPPDRVSIEKFFNIVRGGGNCCLLVDEAHNVAKGEAASPALLHLCRVRRPYGVDLFFTSTQPQDLHATAWSVITRTSVFHSDSAYALDRLKREVRITKDHERAILALRPFEYLIFGDAEGEHELAARRAA